MKVKFPDEDDALDLEFAYTPWSESCQVLYSAYVCCRRRKGHPLDFHAAGHKEGRIKWPVVPDVITWDRPVSLEEEALDQWAFWEDNVRNT